MNTAIEWLESNYPQERFTPGFERINQALELLGLRAVKSKVITVAGTNGKGTVSSLVYNNILKNKYSAALFSSPHLFSVCERFSFNGELISEDELLINLKKIDKKLADNSIELSFYEFLFVTFLEMAKQRSLEYLVLEVGLGGRLDATSSVRADICILTSISRDHVELLGHRYDQILMEKIAIAKSESTLISSFDLSYLYDLSREYCVRNNIKLIGQLSERSLEKTNEFLVSKALGELGLEFIPSRREVVSTTSEDLSYSCCHNLSAVRNLVRDLLCRNVDLSDRILILSYSHRDIKELEYMSKLFLKLKLKHKIKEIYITHIDQFKAMDCGQLKELSQRVGISFLEEKNIDEIRKNNKIYLSGSNYFIGSFISKFS